MGPDFWFLRGTDGKAVRMRSGRFFAYSSEEMAKIGRRILSKELETQLTIHQSTFSDTIV